MKLSFISRIFGLLAFVLTLILMVGISPARAVMNIYVKSLTGQTLILAVSPSTSIEALKQMIQVETGISAYKMTLVQAGVILHETRTLSDYNVQANSTIHYLTSLTGSALVGSDSQTSIGLTGVKAQFAPGHACESGLIMVTKAQDFPGVTSDPGEMPLYWQITTDCAGEFSLDLSLCYFDSDLGYANTVNEANLAAYRHNTGQVWDNMGGTVDVDANCVTLTGITALSTWTIGDPTSGGPTALKLSRVNANPAGIRVEGLIGLALTLTLVIILLHRRANLLRQNS